MEDWLACEIELADGTLHRFGPDEADEADIPSSVEWQTQNPGGFADGSVVVHRPEWATREALLFSPARIYGPGNRTRYEGRVRDVSQVDTDSIRLDFEGWSTHLDDNESWRQLYVDRDLSAWTAPTRARRLLLYSVFRHVADPTIEGDSTLPSLALIFEAGWVNPVGEAFYDAGPGQTISSIYYDMTSASTSSYVGRIGVSSDQISTASDLTANLLTGASSSATGTHTPTAAYRYGYIVFYFAGTVAAGQDQHFTVRNLAVFGDHGLTKAGAAPDEGYLGSDVLAHAISQAAPMLNVSADSIEISTFVITQLVHDSGTVRELVEQVTALGGAGNLPNDWGVYDDRTFYWRTPGTYGRTWRVRRDQVATPNEDGPSSDERFASVVVAYTDAAGATKTVGPLGSGSDYEDARLTDADDNNPATRVVGRTVRRDVGITTQEGAVLIGQAILAEQSANTRRGSVTIQGEAATDEGGFTEPSCAIRAGDRIVVEDEGGVLPSAQYINQTSYSHDTATLTANLGIAPQKVEVLLAQLQAVTPT